MKKRKGVITFDGDVTSIGKYAFYDCSSLTSITIPNSVTSIGFAAFYNCSFTSIVIPNSITSIGENAFYWCLSLTSIAFEGTMEEWNNITKGTNWYIYTRLDYVQCTDGQIPLVPL